MPDIILYSAISVDGYIARMDGSVDWLSPFEGGQEDYGYYAFYDSVEALIMGRNTYEQILDSGEWPYPGKQTYVFTSRDLKSDLNDISFVHDTIAQFMNEPTTNRYARMWLVGGAKLAAAFQLRGLIDEYIVSIIPVLLGGGIPLFSETFPETSLDLHSSKRYRNGLVQVHYTSKKA